MSCARSYIKRYSRYTFSLAITLKKLHNLVAKFPQSSSNRSVKMMEFYFRVIKIIKKWLMLKFGELKNGFRRYYSKAFILEPDGDCFAVVKKVELFCGFHANIKTTKYKFLWILHRLIILARFYHTMEKFILTFIKEDDFEYKFLVHTVTYLLLYSYILVFLLRFFYQNLTSIRKFINERSFRKNDSEAHRIRSAVFRKINWVILGPLPMLIGIWASMIFTGVYKWRVVNIDPDTLASYPLLQQIVQYAYQMQNLIVGGWLQLPSMIINSVLLGFMAELEILANA